MIIAGIDPGKDGGYVEVDGDTGRVRTVLDLERALSELVVGILAPDHVFVERAQVMAINDRQRPSAVASFTYGEGYGIIQGILRAKQTPHTMVRPAEWSRVMHQGTHAGEGTTTKQRSLEAARRLFPEQTWLKGEKSRKPNDGLYEAALICEYGRRVLMGGITTLQKVDL